MRKDIKAVCLTSAACALLAGVTFMLMRVVPLSSGGSANYAISQSSKGVTKVVLQRGMPPEVKKISYPLVLQGGDAGRFAKSITVHERQAIRTWSWNPPGMRTEMRGDYFRPQFSDTIDFYRGQQKVASFSYLGDSHYGLIRSSDGQWQGTLALTPSARRLVARTFARLKMLPGWEKWK